MSLEQIDIFGSSIGLNFKRESVYKTRFGGTVSLLFFAFVGVFFYSQIISFLRKETVTFTQSKEYDVTIPTITRNKHQFMFAIKLDQTKGDFLTSPLFNITWDRREYTTETNGTKIKTTYPMQFEPCTASHWEGLPNYGGVNWTSLYTDGGLSSFLCPRIDDVIKFGGSYSVYGFQFIKVQVKPCVNANDPTRLWQPTCKTSAEVASYFTASQSVTVMFRVNNYVINPNDPKTPIKSYIEDSLFFPVQPGTAYQTADIYLTQNNVNTDQSILPFTNIEQQDLMVFNGGNFRIQYVIGNASQTVADFFIRKDPITYTYDRSFTKISEIAAQIGGFCQTFIIICAIIVSQYNSYLCTLELANKIYDFEQGEETKKQQNHDPPPDSNNLPTSRHIIPPKDLPKQLPYPEENANPNSNPFRNDNQNFKTSLKVIDILQPYKQEQQQQQTTPLIIFPIPSIQEISKKSIITPESSKADKMELQQMELNTFQGQQNGENSNNPNYLLHNYNIKILKDNSSNNSTNNCSNNKNKSQNPADNNVKNTEDLDVPPIQLQQVEKIFVFDDSIDPETPYQNDPNRVVSKNDNDKEDDDKKSKENSLSNSTEEQKRGKQSNSLQQSVDSADKQQQNNNQDNFNFQRQKYQKKKTVIDELFHKNGMSLAQKTQNNEKHEHLRFNFDGDHDNPLQEDNKQQLQGRQILNIGKNNSNSHHFFPKFNNSNNANHINGFEEVRKMEKEKIQNIQNERDYLQREFGVLVNRDKSLKLTYRYFIYKLSLGKFFKTPDVVLLDKARDLMEKEMDVSIILNNIKEMQKLKDLLLDKDQQILFNFFPKPIVHVEDDQKLLTRAEMQEFGGELSKQSKHTQQQKIQEVAKNQKIFQVNFKMAAMIQKAASQFKDLVKNKKSEDKDRIDALERLHNAYQNKLVDQTALINTKLIEMLGPEINQIFSTSKKIKESNMRILKKAKENKLLVEKKKNNPQPGQGILLTDGGLMAPEQIGLSMRNDTFNKIPNLSEHPTPNNQKLL